MPRTTLECAVTFFKIVLRLNIHFIHKKVNASSSRRCKLYENQIIFGLFNAIVNFSFVIANSATYFYPSVNIGYLSTFYNDKFALKHF